MLNVPRMHSDVVHQQIAEIAGALYRRTDELAPVLARAITREVRLYRATTPVPFEVIVSGCAGNMRPIFSAIADDSAFDPTAAAELGIQRAGDGVPLTSLMEAYRVGFRCVWDAVMTESAMHNHINGPAMRVLTAKVSAAQDIYTDAMVLGYRNEQSRRLLSGDYERRVLMDSLLGGRLFGQHSLWEAVQRLRLPSGGPFVVVAGGPRSRHRSIADDRVEAAQRRSMPPRFWGMSSLHVVRNRPFLYAPGVVPRVRHSVS